MTSRLQGKQTLEGSIWQTSHDRKNLFLIRAISKHSTHRVPADHQQLPADHQQNRTLLQKVALYKPVCWGRGVIECTHNKHRWKDR